METRFRGTRRSEDELAFLRDCRDFRNLLIVELPNGNYADTIARQFLFDSWHWLALKALTHSRDEQIAGIAAKGVARRCKKHNARIASRYTRSRVTNPQYYR